MNITRIAVVYFSGYGHTKRLAKAVLSGLSSEVNVNVDVMEMCISNDGELSEEQWQQLDASHAIIFGSPTYMGTVSWQFKKFSDQSSTRWFNRTWQDKLASGFTNSASINGDKDSTLNYLCTLAMQHGMLWIGNALPPANSKESTRNDINYLGASKGLMAQSPSGTKESDAPVMGDLETAKLFANRIVQLAAKFHAK